MASWSDIQRGIFAGESGGDYNALFNYQNRPNGIFSDVRVSDMSIADVLRFTDPRGEYGQYVASARPDPEMGVATPVGAYQVVGATLRDAVKALNLDPNQKFDKATQDKVGQWIYQTQGTGAWQGYKGPQSKPKDMNMSMNPNAPQRTGLLGFMDMMRKPDEETGLTAMERFGAALDPLILPEARAGEQIRARGARRLQTQAKNKTIDTLTKRAESGDQLAAMVLQGLQSGAYDAKTAMSLYMSKKLEAPKDTRTSQIKNYEYWISKGKTPAEAEALVKSGQTIQIGGAAGAEEEFFKKKYERLGTEFAKIQERSGQAGANNLTINALKQLYQVAPSGPVQGRLAELFPEANDVSAAVQSLRTQLAPQLRVEGSGSTSDIEYAGMLNSLGSLKNSPQANAALLDLMLVKNEILQKKSEIAARTGMPEEQGGLTIQQAEIAMLDIDRQMWSENAMVTSIKQLIENAGGFTASSGGNTITTEGGLTVQFD